jgi:hypothetical protein
MSAIGVTADIDQPLLKCRVSGDLFRATLPADQAAPLWRDVQTRAAVNL